MAVAVQHADDRALLEVYLADHLAAGTAGVALAERCLRSNPDGELGAYLRRLVDELEQDRTMVESVIHRLGLRPSRGKVVAAQLAERAGRLKLNGQLRGYSPLSRVVELEGLAAGVDARCSMLRLLRDLSGAYPTLREFPLDELIERAERQHRDLGRLRLEAARQAFAQERAGAP